MLTRHILRHLSAAGGQLQPWCSAAQTASAAAAAAADGPTAPQHRSVHTNNAQMQAADAATDEDSVSTEQQWAAQQQQQQDSWTPPRALPPPGTYGLKITIKAHELILVKLASTVVRDLILIHLAPKSRQVLPEEWRNEGVGVPWVDLAVPVGDASIPIQRTHFTVIKGPHVHKISREQFARTTHTRVIKVATNNLSELDWLLHSIKLYKFVGVELSFRITSSSYLLPTSTSQLDAAQQPLLAGHKQRFAHLFGAAAPGNEAPGGSGPTSNSYATIQQALSDLRADMHRGLLQQRLQLAAVGTYGRWQQTREGDQAAAAAAAAGDAAGPDARKLPGQQVQQAAAGQLEGSSMLASAASEEEGSSAGGASKEQVLLTALDKLLSGVKTDVLQQHKYFPYLMAFYQPGKQQTSPAEWMQAVLMYGKHRQAQVDASRQQPAVQQRHQQYNEASRAALLLALQQWYKATDGASRTRLVLPDAAGVQELQP